MKFLSRCVALILILTLCLLAGCVTVPDSSTSVLDTTTGKRPSVPIIGDVDTTEATEPAGSSSISNNPNIKFLPEEIENPDGLPVLTWLCLEAGNLSKSGLSQDAAIEVNRVLAEKNMPFRLQFALNFDGFWVMDWTRNPEKYISMVEEADLVYGHFLAQIAQQYLLPLTQYTDENAETSLAGAVPHEAYWDTAAFNGGVYGVPASVQYAKSFGWLVDGTVFSDYGIKTEEFDRPYWELDDLFSKIYAMNGNRPFLYDEVGDYWIETDPETEETAARGGSGVNNEWPKMDYVPKAFQYPIRDYFQLVGSCFGIDFRNGAPKVVNYLETDYVRLSQEAMLRYRKAGYLTTNDSTALIQYTECFSNRVAKQTYDAGSYYYIPAQQAHFYTDQQICRMNGISATSEYQNEALMLLSLMANDENFLKLLLFGVEGQDYTVDDSGTPQAVIREDGSRYNMGFLSPYSELCGTKGNVLVPTENGSSRLQVHRESIDNALISCDIIFDFSAVEAELGAVNAIINRQFPKNPDKDPPLNFSVFGNLTEAEYDYMLSEIKAAGSDKILAELQRQLDEWLAENPDWNK